MIHWSMETKNFIERQIGICLTDYKVERALAYKWLMTLADEEAQEQALLNVQIGA